MGTELIPNESDLEDIKQLRQKLRDFLRFRDPKLVSDNDDDLKNIGVKVLDVPTDDKKSSPKSDKKHRSRKHRSRSRSSSKRSKKRKSSEHESRKSRHKDETDEKVEKHKSHKSRHKDEADEKDEKHKSRKSRHKDEDRKHKKRDRGDKAEKSKEGDSKRHKESSSKKREGKREKTPEAIDLPENDDFEVSSEVGSVINMVNYLNKKEKDDRKPEVKPKSFQNSFVSKEPAQVDDLSSGHKESSKSKVVIKLQNKVLPRVNSVFNEEEPAEKVHTRVAKIKLEPFEITAQDRIELMTKDERNQMIKELIEAIPTSKEALFKYQVAWNQLNDELIGKVIKPWVSKQIRGYSGDDKSSLVDHICDKVAARIEPTKLFDDLITILKKDTEIFMIKLWRLIIYQAEAKRVGLLDSVSRSR